MRLQVDKGTLEEFWDARYLEPDEEDFLHKEDDPILITRLILGESSDVELPTPFDGARFSIYSHGERIQYGFEFVFEDDSPLLGASSRFRNALESKKLNFYQTAPLCTGLIRNADEEAIFDLVNGHGEEKAGTRFLSCGMHGSKIRRYQDVKTLLSDISEFSTIADAFVASCVNEYNSKRKSGRVHLPHTTLYLGIDLVKR